MLRCMVGFLAHKTNIGGMLQTDKFADKGSVFFFFSKEHEGEVCILQGYFRKIKRKRECNSKEEK